MLDIPFYVFWFLLFWGRDKLRLKGILIAITVLIALYYACSLTAYPSLFFSAMALLDAVLVLIVFGGDVRLG